MNLHEYQSKQLFDRQGIPVPAGKPAFSGFEAREAAQALRGWEQFLVDLLAEWRSGEAVAGHDAAEVTWADPADLAPYGLWKETERITALALQKRNTP